MNTPKTLTLHLLRTAQHARNGDTCFVLYGRRQDSLGPEGPTVTLRIGSSNCPLDVADVIAMAREGDTLSLSYTVVEDMGTQHYLYSKAALMANFPGPRGMLLTGGLTSEGNHALMRD